MSEIKYPCLMKNFKSGLMVMVESVDEYGNGTGVVVGGGNGSSEYIVGSTSTVWAIENFRVYKGNTYE